MDQPVTRVYHKKEERTNLCHQGLNYPKFLSPGLSVNVSACHQGLAQKGGEDLFCHQGLNYPKFFVTRVQIFESAGHQGLSLMGEKNYFGHQS